MPSLKRRPRVIKHCAQDHQMDVAWRTCPVCTGEPPELIARRGDLDRTVMRSPTPRASVGKASAPVAAQPTPAPATPRAPAHDAPVAPARVPPTPPLPPALPPEVRPAAPTLVRRAAWVLVGTEGAARGMRIELTGERVRIGKAPRAEPGVRVEAIDDPFMSREHIVIDRLGDGWLLRDVGSRNGTAVNDARVEEHALRPGDVVKAGRLAFRVELAAADGDATE